MSTQNFVYNVLPNLPNRPRFRLLDLDVKEPRDAETEAPISGRIVTSSIENAPPYVALSYTWGPPDRERRPNEVDEKHQISINGAGFEVGQNLHDALIHIRKRCQSLGNDQTTYFWIDAISINQNDEAEKSTQVNLMRHIYRNSTKAWIWLGPRKGIRMDRVKALVSKIAAASRDVQKRLQTLGASAASADWDTATDQGRLFTKYKPSPLGSSDWVDLALFFARKWWYRIWCIQEVVLPPYVDVMCGEHMLGWDEVYSCSTLMALGLHTQLGHQLQRKKASEESITSVGTGLVTLNRITTLLRSKSNANVSSYLVGDHEPKSESAILCILLHMSRGWQSSQPEDQVNALLGMLGPEAHRLRPNFAQGDISTLLKADYDKDVTEVFSLTAKTVIEQTRWLGFLTLIEDRSCRTIDGMASWVPDLTSIPPERAGITSDFAKYLPRLREYSSQKLAIGTPNVKGNVLRCAGTRLGVVTNVSEHLEYFCAGRTAFEAGASMILQSKQTYPFSKERREDMLWQTLIGSESTEPFTEPSPKLPFSSFWLRKLVEIALRSREGLDTFDETVPQMEKLGRSVSDAPFPTHDKIRRAFASAKINNATDKLQGDVVRESGAFEGDFRRMCQSRRLFLTNRHHMGIGHCSMQEGDELWFLARGPTPFVLRKVEGDETGFVLIGHAYVHGFFEEVLPSLEVKRRIRIL